MTQFLYGYSDEWAAEITALKTARARYLNLQDT